jgi:hypothetical protein
MKYFWILGFFDSGDSLILGFFDSGDSGDSEIL